jgi:hypothetical protein
MSVQDNLKIDLEKRLNDRLKYKLSLNPLKEDIEKLIEWLFKLLDKIDKEF